jgi:hypothetical protein
VIVRLFLWNVADSQTTLDELRTRLPELELPSAWVANDAADRFGLVAFGDDAPDLDAVVGLIGREPDAAEEFEVVAPNQYR